jgi:hypothetical protein
MLTLTAHGKDITDWILSPKLIAQLISALYHISHYRISVGVCYYGKIHPLFKFGEINIISLFDVYVTVHRRHSEGKEPSRCDKVCSFYASTCFGHQYAHHHEYN